MLLGTAADLGIGLPFLCRSAGNENAWVDLHRDLLAAQAQTRRGRRPTGGAAKRRVCFPNDRPLEPPLSLRATSASAALPTRASSRLEPGRGSLCDMRGLRRMLVALAAFLHAPWPADSCTAATCVSGSFRRIPTPRGGSRRAWDGRDVKLELGDRVGVATSERPRSARLQREPRPATQARVRRPEPDRLCVSCESPRPGKPGRGLDTTSGGSLQLASAGWPAATLEAASCSSWRRHGSRSVRTRNPIPASSSARPITIAKL